MTQLPGKFVWFEHISPEPKKAQAFYGEAVGWKVEAMPMGESSYDMIKVPSGTIGGYAVRNVRGPAHWISYVSVTDVDATAKAAVAAGGKLVEAPLDMPGIGRMARIADPQGAELCLFTSADGDEPDRDGAGRFCWNELWTLDARKALAFYEKVFGYSHKEMPGSNGPYYILEKDGVGRGGLMAVPEGTPRWVPYVAVDDTDAAVARATKQGGTVTVPATDIPDVGRFAVFTDPTGAAFAVLKPAPR